jgi:predicted kinase
MLNVCPVCGIYAVEKEIRPKAGWQALAVCPHCGHAQPFLRLPLFCVSGASGSGKSTLALSLSARDTPFVHLESDILWRPEFDQPATGYRDFRETWLRLAKNINQGGRPVILYGSADSSQFELCLERRYFAQVYTLALVCEPPVLAARLRARPGWRDSGSEEFILKMQEYNHWFIEHACAETQTLDTSQAALEESGAAVLRWALERWNQTSQPEVQL